MKFHLTINFYFPSGRNITTTVTEFSNWFVKNKAEVIQKTTFRSIREECGLVFQPLIEEVKGRYVFL